MAEHQTIRWGVRRALIEIESILECQWVSGMLPHIRYVPGGGNYRPGASDWAVPHGVTGGTAYETSGITQPPLLGYCLYDVFLQMTPEEREVESVRLISALLAIDRYHEWLLRERDPLAWGLAACVHPWESGTDNSPAFDEPLAATGVYLANHRLALGSEARADNIFVGADQRPTERDYFSYFGLVALFRSLGYSQPAIIDESPFLAYDVLFNTLLAASLRACSALGEAVIALLPSGHRQTTRLREISMRSAAQAKGVSEAVRSRLWNSTQQMFCGHDARASRALRVHTVSGLLPLLGDIANTHQTAAIESSLDEPTLFSTHAPVPSTAVSGPQFERSRYWRGPSWPVTNWLIVRGLKERGSNWGPLRRKTLAMIAPGASEELATAAASSVMQANSFGNRFTTPSPRQYGHAWLWDSAVAAVGWCRVDQEPRVWTGVPCFYEYFDPFDAEPLGAPNMTWTAAVYLDLVGMIT